MITLTHFLRGPMAVSPVMKDGQREWFCPDRPMLRPMGDEVWREKRSEIEALLAATEQKDEKVRDAIAQDQRDQQRGAYRPW
jgi:hypothetical protein